MFTDLFLGFVTCFDLDSLIFSLFLEVGFFDFCGVFFAEVPSFFKFFNFVPELSLDSDCDFTVFSFYTSSCTFDLSAADMVLIDFI